MCFICFAEERAFFVSDSRLRACARACMSVYWVWRWQQAICKYSLAITCNNLAHTPTTHNHATQRTSTQRNGTHHIIAARGQRHVSLQQNARTHAPIQRCCCIHYTRDMLVAVTCWLGYATACLALSRGTSTVQQLRTLTAAHTEKRALISGYGSVCVTKRMSRHRLPEQDPLYPQHTPDPARKVVRISSDLSPETTDSQ